MQLAGSDDNRIRQLTEMSFPRSVAERSLLHSRNNVSATTGFLLSHPFPLPPDPIPEAAPAEEEPAILDSQAPAEDHSTTEGEAAAPPDGASAGDAHSAPAASAARAEGDHTSGNNAQVPSAAPSGEVSSTTTMSEPVPPPLVEEPPAPPGRTAEEWLNELNAAREPL